MAGNGRKKDRREARLRDIMQDASGNVIYTGDLWKISEDTERHGRGRRAALTAGLVLIIITVVGSGCIDAKSAMGAFYVVLPYIGEVSALFGLAWNAARMLYPSEGVRTYVLEQAKPRISAACRILTVFAAAGFALSALYLILNGAGKELADSIAYLLLKLAAAALSEWYRKLFSTTEWKKNN